MLRGVGWWFVLGMLRGLSWQQPTHARRVKASPIYMRYKALKLVQTAEFLAFMWECKGLLLSGANTHLVFYYVQC
jgi:hypothetical protein